MTRAGQPLPPNPGRPTSATTTNTRGNRPMPIHRTLSHPPRTTATATDGSGRTVTGADEGTVTGADTARGIGAARPDAKAPAPAARGTLHDDLAGGLCALGIEGVTSGALAASPARHGAAANGPLRIRRSTGRSTLAPSATAPRTDVDAVPSRTRNALAVAAPLLLKAA